MKSTRILNATLLASTVAFGATALLGCPQSNLAGLSNPTGGTSGALSDPNADSVTDAANVINQLADFDSSSTQLSADLAGATDTGAGASVQSLAPQASSYSVQDLSGSLNVQFQQAYANLNAALAVAPGWTPASASVAWASGSTVVATPSLVPNWIANAYPRVIAHGTIGSSTESFYVANNATTRSLTNFAHYYTATHKGVVVTDQFDTPDATSSPTSLSGLPSPFNNLTFTSSAASASVAPTQYFVRTANTTYFTWGSPGSSAVGVRYAIHDASSGLYRDKPLIAWCRAIQGTRANPKGPQSILHYDVATNYKPTSRGKTPYEYISDDVNSTANTHYHQDRVYTDSNTTWTSTGTFTGPDGTVRTTTETFNVATGARSKTVSWTNAKKQAIVMTMTFGEDRSGTGTLTANGTQFATMSWSANGKGTLTLASGQTTKFTASY